MVAAWEEDFTGYVLDYGTYPDQKRPYFTLRDAQQTLATGAPRRGPGGRDLRGARSALTASMLGREWRRDDGRGAADRAVPDRRQLGRQHGRRLPVLPPVARIAGVVMPSHGRFVGASSQPFSRIQAAGRATASGTTGGSPTCSGKRAVRHVLFDTNYWKSFVHARLAVAMGDRGCLSLFGDKPEHHRLFAEH